MVVGALCSTSNKLKLYIEELRVVISTALPQKATLLGGWGGGGMEGKEKIRKKEDREGASSVAEVPKSKQVRKKKKYRKVQVFKNRRWTINP